MICFTVTLKVKTLPMFLNECNKWKTSEQLCDNQMYNLKICSIAIVKCDVNILINVILWIIKNVGRLMFAIQRFNRNFRFRLTILLHRFIRIWKCFLDGWYISIMCNLFIRFHFLMIFGHFFLKTIPNSGKKNDIHWH